ncbi:MAG: DNA polymerase III subunit beta [Actinobacteria bacterium]|nr:DNA polymerase III subunit beta [Actinomycetota bacterium]MBM3712491.1 DNA polymerase III subunit beta [Actinomycetota bacterium]
MKIQTTRDDILNKMLFISRAVSPKISNFILSGVMLEAEGKVLNIFGTDLETSVRSSIHAKVENPGRVIVPSRILINVLKSFPESKVELELMGQTNELMVTCLNANFRLNTFSLEEYPQFPSLKERSTFKIDAAKLKDLILRVQKSCSTDESRIILTGILIDLVKDTIKLAATDSYRLSVASGSVSYNGNPVKVVVPSRVLDTISKSDAPEGQIEINVEENQISFILIDKGNLKTTVVSRLLSGKFPDYETLIPQSLNQNIIINKDVMLNVIRRISSISQDNIPIKLDIEKGRITVSMNIREVGSSSEGFEVGYGEGSIQLAFNPDFLIDGLNIIDEEKILFGIVEPLKPVMIRPEKSEALLYLLMPIRIS